MIIKNKSLLLIGIAIISCMFLVAIPPVSATDTFYYRNTTPQNNIYEKIVHPGDTIVLGRTYDLTYVSGTTKKYAWWNNWKIEGTTCTPDIIINTSYIDTKGMIRPDSVYLDPKQWKTGNWFQWDGCYELPYEKGQTEPRYAPYIRDNNLVFRIIYDPVPPTQIPVRITIPPEHIYTTQTPKPPPTMKITTIPPTPVPTKENFMGYPIWDFPFGLMYIFGFCIVFVILRLLW